MKKFEVDTQSLSRRDAIIEIINDGIDKEKKKIGTASWTPLKIKVINILIYGIN